MINRDFSKSKKEYIINNKLPLVIIVCFLLVGLICAIAFGFNYDTDFKGCEVVNVNIGHDINVSTFNSYEDKIQDILNENGLNLYNVQLKGEGSSTTLEIRYTGKANSATVEKFNAGLVTKLDVEATDISEHEHINKTIVAKDYIYSIATCLIIATIVTIFIMIRHNLAYALASLSAGAFSVLALLSVYSILRLSLTRVIFVICLFAMIYTFYESLILFEKMRKVAENPEYKNDKSKQLTVAMKSISSRMQFTSIGLFLIGFMFVLFGTSLTRQIAVGWMFAVVASLVSVSFTILPFVYNLTIDRVKIREPKQKKVDDKKKVEADNKTDNVNKDDNTNAKTEQEVVEEKPVEEKEIEVEVIEKADITTNNEE